MDLKNFIDISWPISPAMTTYKDNKPVHFTAQKTFAVDHVRDTTITLNTHTGTHIDAPAHFLQDGATTEKLLLSAFNGPCTVLDLAHVNEQITKADLEKLTIEKNRIILLKTKNSLHDATAAFDFSFVYLTVEAAEFLVEKKIRAVGIDYLGIERNQPGHPTHKKLLSSNIPIIEGLRLENVVAGHFTLLCLPLALHGLEATPARAILYEI